MADACESMLGQALDAFSRNDPVAGRAVCVRDDEIDSLYVQIFRELITFILEDSKTVTRALNLLFAAHNLERIGDRITNIGERVIYAATGKLEELNNAKLVR
jgi:phosphate transport system protein